MNHLQYILKDRTPVSCSDLLEWEKWMQTADRAVAKSSYDIDDETVEVSTVFLGLDHNWNGGTPILFETMIFGGVNDQYQVRYETWEEAEIGHKIACKIAEENVKV